MGGQGAYFTTLSPSKQIGSASWPSVQFREDLLKSNYGDDWKNPAWQQSADAVIVCFPKRPGPPNVISPSPFASPW